MRANHFADEVIFYQTNPSLRIGLALRPKKFDCAILLQNAFEAAWIAWLAGIPNRIGYNSPCRSPAHARREAAEARRNISVSPAILLFRIVATRLPYRSSAGKRGHTPQRACGFAKRQVMDRHQSGRSLPVPPKRSASWNDSPKRRRTWCTQPASIALFSRERAGAL